MTPARVFGFVAAEADVCVLIVQRSKHLNLMVRWDLRTDEFEIGQWLSRQLDLERTALSPDGRLFGYYALNNERKPTEGPHPGHYIVVCRPPFFTALALWWTGGKQADRVIWKGSGELSVGRPAGAHPDKGFVPEDFHVGDPTGAWQGPWVWPSDVRRLERRGLRIEGGPPLERLLHGMPNLDWTDVDHRGRLLLAREGRVLVRDEDGERELIDLDPFEFRPLAPPEWATQWPEQGR